MAAQTELFREITSLSQDVRGIHGVQIDEFQGDQWAQDFGESVVENGQSKFLIPMQIEPNDFSDTLRTDMQRLRKRRNVSQQYFGEKAIITAPFYFGGGNLTCDYVNGQLTVFIGSGDVTRTIDIYSELGRRLSPADVAALISEQFHGAPVVIMGHLEQHSQLNFHIDQSFIFLQDQRVVMNMYDPHGVRESDIEIEYVQQQQEYYIQQLEALGYDVHLLQNTGRDLELSYSSINAVPFVHKMTGEPTIIFPVFPNEIEGDFKDRNNLVDRLLGKAQAAYHLYAKLGYTPIPVRDFANIHLGNTHCLTNVLAL